ncbi:MAG: AAA domain-containing protein [Firmicutes bacterium]|nr:AAA domain-containing protein [Bacillota bacterium]
MQSVRDRSELRDRTIRLFEFMKAVRALRERPVRDMRELREPLWWQRDLPLHPDGCILHPVDDPDPRDDGAQDAWLTVCQQSVPPAPALPAEFHPWVDDPVDDPEREPRLLATPKRVPEAAFDPPAPGGVVTADPERIGRWERWLREEWRPWAARALGPWRVQRLYHQLFLLRQRLQREQDLIELVWGHGVLSWEIQGEQIFYPLLITRMELDFDPEAGRIRVVPGSRPTALETAMLDGLEIPGLQGLTALAGRLANEPPGPWDLEGSLTLYRKVVKLISHDGEVLDGPQVPPPGPRPVIVAASALFVRRKRAGYLADIQRILDALRSDHPVPAPIASVVAYDQRPEEEEARRWRSVGEELLLPLPANPEQEEIARRLAAHHGVTVQGPPGTGKSHTIANLIGHLLAHGKRVLVTSHTERPLRVLREKIPEPLRPLCIHLTGTDADSLKQLEESVQAMAERLGSLDQELAQRRVQELRQELDQVRREIADLRRRIREVSERERQRYHLDGRDLSPSELGQWLRSHEQDLGFIPDAVPPDASPPLTPQELARVYELARDLAPQDRAAVAQHRPDPAELPRGLALQEAAAAVAEADRVLAQAPPAVREWQPPPAVTPEDLAELQRRLSQAQEQLARFEEPWLAAIREDAARGGARRQQWEDLVSAVAVARDRILQWKSQVAGRSVTLPANQPLAELVPALEALAQHLAAGKGLNFLVLLTRPALKRVVANCRIDGAQVRTAADAQVLLAEVRLRLERHGLAARWNQMVGEVNGPLVDAAQPRMEIEIDDLAEQIRTALNWETAVWEPLRDAIRKLGLPVPEQATAGSLDALRRSLELAGHRLVLVRAQHKFSALRRRLETGATTPNASPLWGALLAALEHSRWDDWDAALAEARRLQSLEPQVRELEDLADRLRQQAPLWAQRILESRGNPAVAGPPERFAEAWRWRQAETWLSCLLADDPEPLQRRLEGLLERERRIVVELVAESTWLAQARRVTDEQRRALVGWQQLVRRIGKGTGKYAARYRRQAQEQMRRCRSAVPVWIMPLDRVVENIDPLDEPFDVVIVDESSQCDLFSLLALFRARRAVIVGDDNQISPQAVGVDHHQVHLLIEQYLEGIPNRELFDPRQSLYDLATRVFPGVIMLREHFRCLPEIIQFSNDLMYEGRILPLREESRDPSWQPVVARRVSGYREPGTNVNPPEAEALVETLVACCRNPAYAGKTMGVISLLGEDQARLIEQLLLERLGPVEMEKRKILCGDAYYFQGDERDVIFLSMVEASGQHRKATMNRLSDRQRFNVAASRARDQMWLFYSVDPSELHPEDVRVRLIQYCEQPHRMTREYEDLAARCESEFERQVLKELMARGYAVRPQVRVGHYRIDLVVEGMRSRLAIECDGDAFHGPDRWEADLRRQMTLERMGWRFFRIRGSAFYRNRERALAPLWERLQELGIEPMRRS